jgi:hypothetical protein
MSIDRVQDLEQQLAHLRWKRMQNERHIRTSLEVTKSLQQRDKLMHVGIDSGTEKSMWLASVVKDELQRPLVISDEEIHKIQTDEARVKKMLGKYAQVKLNTVKRLNEELKEKEKIVTTTTALRENKQKQLSMAKIEQEIKKVMRGVDKRRDIVPVRQIPPKLFD